MTSQLSVDLLESVSALLGAVARMIARSGAISERQLGVLLLGADLQSAPEAREELLRWTAILKQVHGESDEEIQQAAVEALMLRGVGEGPALLAVATVSDSSMTTLVPNQKASVEEILIDPPSLELGSLRPGERATAQITVHGGRGTVQVDSDRVRVEPMQFGPDVTKLQVHIEPVPDGMLYTSLRLLSDCGAVEVPVTVQWTEQLVLESTEIPVHRYGELRPDHPSIQARSASSAPPADRNLPSLGLEFEVKPQPTTVNGIPFWVWGHSTLPSNQLRTPESIAVNSRGAIYISDSGNHRVQKLDGNGNLLDEWYRFPGMSAFKGPGYIHVDERDVLYVHDDNRILQLSARGASVRWDGAGDRNAKDFSDFDVDDQGNLYIACESHVAKYGTSGQMLESWPRFKGSHDFSALKGIRIDSAGNVYLIGKWRELYREGYRLIKGSPYGEFLDEWRLPQEVLFPSRLEIREDRHCYFADHGQHCVWRLSLSDGSILRLGGRGSATGQFFKPRDARIGHDGKLYVADAANHRVQELTRDGSFLRSLGGMSHEEFVLPRAISTNGKLVAVANSGDDRIIVVSADGRFVCQLSWQGCAWAVAIDAEDRIYAPYMKRENSKWSSGLQLASLDGHILESWPMRERAWGIALDAGRPGYAYTAGGEVLFIQRDVGVPRAIEVDMEPEVVAVGPDGYLYGSVPESDQIVKFAATGEVLAVWGGPGSQPGRFTYPRGIAVDNGGCIYVADMGNHRIQKLSAAGEPLCEWGELGSEIGQFRSPSGVAVDDAGHIYVADMRNERVQKFRPGGGERSGCR